MKHQASERLVLEPELVQRLIAVRRDIHAHPELAFQEFRTAGLIADFLRALGLDVTTGVGRTGVVALLDTGRPGRTVGMRADMDALPMSERSGLPFRSQVDNVAHTCGHDVHSACLLGAASLLVAMRETLSGRFKFIFQPAEESLEGARAMIADGVLDGPRVEVMLGVHNWPPLPAGKVAWRHGASMAASNAFVIDIKGKAGHAAHPQTGVDAMQALAMVLPCLNAIVTREFPAHEAVILTVGKVQGGKARNIICEEVRLEGTCRTLNDSVTDAVEAALARALRGIAEATRADIVLQWQRLAPALCNDRLALDTALRGVRRVIAADDVVELDTPSMGSEDFAWYGRHVPLAHLRIGSSLPDRSGHLHQSDYVCDERAIEVGALALAAGAIELSLQPVLPLPDSQP